MPLEEQVLQQEQLGQRQQPWCKTAWSQLGLCRPEEVQNHGGEAAWGNKVALEEATAA